MNDAERDEVESIFEALQTEEKHAFLTLESEDVEQWNDADEEIQREFRQDLREECAQEAAKLGYRTLLICDEEDNVLCIGCQEDEDTWGFLELADDANVNVEDVFGGEEEQE